MNSKIIKLSCIFLFTSGIIKVNAQQAPIISGGNASGSGGSASYSVGQIIYATNIGSNGAVLNGVQQPFEIYTVGISENEFQISLIAFPNPTADNLVLKTDKSNTGMFYQLMDMQGKIIEIEKIETNEINIIMKDLSSGIYFLKVNDKNKNLQTFKIIKN